LPKLLLLLGVPPDAAFQELAAAEGRHVYEFQKRANGLAGLRVGQKLEMNTGIEAVHDIAHPSQRPVIFPDEAWKQRPSETRQRG